MTRTARPDAGGSADDRRRTRRELLRTGVLDVGGRNGVAGATVDAVCAAAGLTKRYFYESFTNLDAALVAALDTAFVELSVELTDAVRTLSEAQPRARAMAEVLVDSLAADPRLTRLYTEAPGHPALRERREQAVADFTDLMLSEALTLLPGHGYTDRQRLGVRLVVAGTTDLVAGWLSGTLRADRATIVDAIVAAGLAVSGAD